MKKLFKRFLNAKVNPLVVAATGAAVVQAVPMAASDAATAAQAISESTGDPVTIIIQIILGLASLWKILRKKNEETNG